MTYGRVGFASQVQTLDGAVVSHSAELVRGSSCVVVAEAPSSALRAPSPQGEKGLRGPRWRITLNLSATR
jgi:hypothetical protein